MTAARGSIAEKNRGIARTIRCRVHVIPLLGAAHGVNIPSSPAIVPSFDKAGRGDFAEASTHPQGGRSEQCIAWQVRLTSTPLSQHLGLAAPDAIAARRGR